MNFRDVSHLITGLIVGLFFIGSAQAQTQLIWDSNGNMIGSVSQAQINQFNRDLTAYNEARKAGAVKTATVDAGKVVATRAATLNFGAAAGLGRAAALGLEEFVRYPLSSVGRGLVTVARLNPLGIAGTVAATILLEKGISVVNGVWTTTTPGQPASEWGGGYNYQCTGAPAGPITIAAATQCGNYAGWTGLSNVQIVYVSGQWRATAYSTMDPGNVKTIAVFSPLGTCPAGTTNTGTSCTSAPTSAPSSDGDIQNAIADGLTANPSRAPDVLKNIYDQGGWVPLDAADQAGWNITTPTVEGKPQVTTTTSTAADGSTLTTTKTTTPKATVSSSGDNVTNNTLTYNITNVTSSVTRNQYGDVVSSSTSTEDKDSEVFQDAAMPEQPNLYTQKFPDGLAGVWRDNKPDVKATEFYQGVASMFPSFGGGQCPAWTTSFNLGAAGNFGNGSFTVPCWIFQALGLVILATAAFTARKIIF